MIRRHSLSFRIITRVLLIASIMFILTVSAYYLFSRSLVRNNARENAVMLAENLANTVQKELVSLEKIPMTIGSSLELDLIPKDSIQTLLEMAIKQNSNIFGLAVSFEPGHFPEEGQYYATFVHRCLQDSSALIKGYVDYDYFLRDWYQIPATIQKPHWSEPYYSEIDARVLMATYSFPFYKQKEGNREFAGIVTVDITLDRLTEMVSGVQIFETGYAFMVSRNGVALSHPVPEQIINESLFSSAEVWNAPMLREIGRDLIAGKTNFRRYDRGDNIHLYMYHTALPTSRWSIGVVYPEREMYGLLQQMNTLMIILVVGGLLTLAFLTIRNINKMAQPLVHFAESAHLIADGDFNVPLPSIETKDEMQELQQAFSHMQKQLADYIDSLKETTSAKEKIESELRIAHEIQMSMIPHSFPPFPDLPQIDLFATLKSAREVGGDLYDFFLSGKDKFFFAIGDVSGKGVPASLFMAVTRTLLRSIAEKEQSANDIIIRLNKALSANNHSCMFVTFFLGILDLNTGTVNYVNAGHNPPVMIKENGDLITMKSSGSVPLGIFEASEYNEQQIQMEPGDMIYTYTDGVNEAENSRSQLFGDENMLETLKKNKNKTLREQITGMTEAIDAHVAGYPQSDDITMLIVAFMDKEKTSRTITLVNRLDELTRISTFLEECAEAWTLPMPLTLSLNLVLEEAFTNVVQYGYNDKEEHDIEIHVEKQKDKLIITLIDDAVPYDPTAKHDPDINLSAEDRPVGGLGIFLIKKTMDEVRYERKDNKNHLIMTKNI